MDLICKVYQLNGNDFAVFFAKGDGTADKAKNLLHALFPDKIFEGKHIVGNWFLGVAIIQAHITK